MSVSAAWKDRAFAAGLALALLAAAGGCVVIGSDESGGIQTPAPGVAVTFPASNRTYYLRTESWIRTVQFEHAADRAVCSRDGGATFAGCDSSKGMVWRWEDYQKERVIKVGRGTDRPWVYRFVPAKRFPGLTFLACDELVSANENFAAFSARLVTAGTAAHPRVICLAPGVTVASAGENAMTLTASNLILIAPASGIATIQNLRTTGTVSGDTVLMGAASPSNVTVVGLKLETLGGGGSVLRDMGPGLRVENSEISTPNYADDPYQTVESSGDLTILSSTLSLGGGGVSGQSVDVRKTDFVSLGADAIGIGVLGATATSSVIEDVTMYGGAFYGVKVLGANKYVQIRGMQANNNIRTLIEVNGTNQLVEISDSYLVASSASDNLRVSGTGQVSVTDSHLVASNGPVLALGGIADVSVLRSHFNLSAAPGISHSGLGALTFKESLLDNVAGFGGDGIDISGGGLVELIGSTINLPGNGKGVWLNGGSRLVLDSSTIEISWGGGIHSTGTDTVTLVGSGLHAQVANWEAGIIAGSATLTVDSSTVTVSEAGNALLLGNGVTNVTNSTVITETSPWETVWQAGSGTVNFTNSLIWSKQGIGFYLQGPSVELHGCTIRSELDAGAQAIHASAATGILVQDSEIYALGMGAYVDGGSSLTLNGTLVQSDDISVQVNDSSSLFVDGSKLISSNGNSVLANGSNFIEIQASLLRVTSGSGGAPFYAYGDGANMTIEGSVFEDSSGAGAIFLDPPNATILQLNRNRFRRLNAGLEVNQGSAITLGGANGIQLDSDSADASDPDRNSFCNVNPSAHSWMVALNSTPPLGSYSAFNQALNSTVTTCDP